MIGGIVLWSAGVSLTGAGTGEIVSRVFCKTDCGNSLDRASLAMLLAGQFAGVIAIPMFMAGHARVPVTAPRPEILVGAGSAALRVSF
jgi:hypothetical protein